MKLNVLKRIWNHPATSGDRLNSIARALYWEFYKRVSKEPIIAKLIGNIRIECDRAFGGSHVAITYRGLYDYDEMMFLRRYLRRGDIVADIGANIGLYSLMISRLVGPDGYVDAFEAVPKVAAQLRRNIALNKIKNIKVTECALGNQKSEVAFNTTGSDLTSHILVKSEDYGALSSIRVPIDRLDSVSDETEYAFVQIDVEGAEPLVLEGAEVLLRKGIPPVISIEINGRLHQFGWTEEDFIKRIGEYGYELAIFDANIGNLKFLNVTKSKEFYSALGSRDNVLAISKKKHDEVITRLSGMPELMLEQINTQSNQSWP